MSACYSVTLQVKFKDVNGAVAALQNKIKRGKEERTNYSIDKWRDEEGVNTDTIDNLIRIFLAGWTKNQFEKKQIDGWDVYYNGFNASYGWEVVMIEMFEELVPFLEDNSYFYIEPDNDYDEFKIMNGKLIQLH